MSSNHSEVGVPGETVAIRPAASILILRDGSVRPEVLTVKRAKTMRFLPGFLAFPGGTLETHDWDAHKEHANVNVLDADQPEDAAYAIGAIRECAEEVGWLCATKGQTDAGDMVLAKEEQVALVSNGMSFRQFLNERLRDLSLEHLRFVGRWITPTSMATRFDTRFFVHLATHPDLPLLLHEEESEWVAWRDPVELLAAIEAREEAAVPPTVAMLRALASYSSAQAAFAQMRVPGPDPETLETELKAALQRHAKTR